MTMFELIDNRMLVPNLHQATIAAGEIARAVSAGQFIILRVEEDGERIPLTVSDWDPDKGTISLVYLVVGKTTQKLAGLAPGAVLASVAGPLGNPMEIEHFGNVICVGGCYGIASIYPIARALKARGNRVTVVVEARSAYLLYWQERLKTVADRLVVITRDGSQGVRGHIGNLGKIIAGQGLPVDRIIINGCNYLMMRGAQESQPLNIKTMVSLNTLMIDGTGMCGVCRVTVGSSTKFACVDGPHFDGHEVNWDELAQRRKAYLVEEAQPFRSSEAG
jgi:ferredoxin/flavodoxin---NADP+ reductase